MSHTTGRSLSKSEPIPFAPFTWLRNKLSLRRPDKKQGNRARQPRTPTIPQDELRKVMQAAGTHIPPAQLDMLLRVLDLASSTVEDIMIPRPQLVGINLADEWHDIEKQLVYSPFTRILVYEDSLDQTLGFLHLRKLMPLLAEGKLDRDKLRQAVRPAYFVPEGTALTQQLLNFREASRRTALVVDEYGEILGLLTMEDILEEIVGEYSTVPVSHARDIQRMEDGSAWLDGATHIREVNRELGTDLPTDGPKTINGLIMEYLESIPVPGMTVLIKGYPMEIRKTRKNAIKTLIIYPRIGRKTTGDNHG